MTAKQPYPTTGQETDESHDNTTPSLPPQPASITGTLAGPHPTPDPLPPAGDDERTLFQAAVNGDGCRVDPPGARTGIESHDRDPTGAVRVWVSDVADDPTPRVTVAVDDARKVVTITASAWPDADTLREWAANVRHRSDDTGTVAVDGGEVSIHSRGGGAEVRDRASDGSLCVGWSDRHAGVSVGAATGDSWARVRLVDDDRDELATAAETAAEVVDDE